jgi:uronate dehydrogenase
VQLVKRSLEAPEVGFSTVYGVSANRRSWWRRHGSETIGNAPVGDAEAFASRIGDQQP